MISYQKDVSMSKIANFDIENFNLIKNFKI